MKFYMKFGMVKRLQQIVTNYQNVMRRSIRFRNIVFKCLIPQVFGQTLESDDLGTKSDTEVLDVQNETPKSTPDVALDHKRPSEVKHQGVITGVLVW